jgi:serine/threonine-protein kinase
MDHLPGMEVGSSTILEELARGGMSIIFSAFQRTLKRRIAVKILPKSVLTAESAQLFQQEAESAAILSHPNIIPVYEVGETTEFLFFTMQLIQGKALSTYISQAEKNIIPSKRILPISFSLKIILSVLDALDYAHNEDIVHRDIKPGNILIEERSHRPLITDFGIARVLRSETSARPGIQGTPMYMPPEQILGRVLDGRSDIYATGTMLFKLLTGTLPIPDTSDTKAFLINKVKTKNDFFSKKPSEINSGLDVLMDRIILKATAYEPDNRFADCREFISAIEFYMKKHL